MIWSTWCTTLSKLILTLNLAAFWFFLNHHFACSGVLSLLLRRCRAWLTYRRWKIDIRLWTYEIIGSSPGDQSFFWLIKHRHFRRCLIKNTVFPHIFLKLSFIAGFIASYIVLMLINNVSQLVHLVDLDTEAFFVISWSVSLIDIQHCWNCF